MPDQAAAEPLTNPSLSSIAATAKTEGVKVDAKLDASEKRQKDTLDEMLATKAPEPKDYQVDKPTPPPQTPPQTDPFQAFGSPAGWIAAFGSLLSRRPLITALNSATAVMQAAKENDQEAFKRHREAWKESSEYAQQLSDWQMNRYEMAFDKYKNDQDKLRSTITVLASQDQNTLMRQAAHSDDAMTMWKAFADQKKRGEDLAIKNRELNIHSQQLEVTLAHYKAMEAPGGPLSEEALDYAATVYRTKGVMPNFGYNKAATVKQVLERAAHQGLAEGEDAVQRASGDIVRQATVKADAASLTKLTGQANAIEAFENTAIKNGDILVDLAKKVDQTGVPVAERWIRAGRQAVAGDTDVAKFHAQMYLYRAEVAKILTNPNLTGVLSDASRKEVEDFLKGSASAQQIAAVHDLLKGDFGRRRDSIHEQITKIKGDIAGKPTSSAAPAAGDDASPPATLLKEGEGTTFSNGQTWTLKNGVPQLVTAGGAKVQ